ncbi:hypothetical protein AYO20_01808 [Fonsecaea nubica]|uniref:DUF6604 domain-containing protein n=1 Tax=Fonsecaea nubica TaxID=856822 RepID=A0A178DBM8_9EURO|nr:hypothetical protein AYO20_01808 [Fonsecaea nubica]OAL39057.1 hypothetical protein AYO20_01808 [Fonsecaea nubica]
MAIVNPEYGKMYGRYKQATDNVLSWIRALYNRPSTIPLNKHLQLAVSAVQDGIQMPENIFENLQTAINLRRQTAELHKHTGTSDHGHDYMITVLQTISTIFAPSRPATPEPASACVAIPEPSPFWQGHLTPRPFTPPPPPRGYFPPVPFQQEWCPPAFCAYDQIYQNQQPPYGAYYSPPLSPPPPPGLYPTWQLPQPQYSYFGPTTTTGTHGIDLQDSMFERAPGY